MIVTYCIQPRAGGSQLTSSLRFGGSPAACLFAVLCCGGVSAQETQSGQDTSSSQESQPTDEISIVKKRETQLNSEALSITGYIHHTLRDVRSAGSGLFSQFGLMTDDYTPKPAFHDYQDLVGKLSG